MLERAVVVDVDVGALARDPKAGPQLLRLVGDVLNSTSAGGIDEVLESSRVSETGDTDDGDLISELFLYRCDRRGFCTSKRSPGGPIPEHHILALEIGEIDRLTRGRRECVGKQRGLNRRGVARGVAGISRGCRRSGRGVRFGGGATARAQEQQCSCEEPNDSGATAKQAHE